MNYTRRAERQIDELIESYEQKGFATALDKLKASLAEAERRITAQTQAGLPAPRPYPSLRQHGQMWLKAGRYWVRYTMAQPPTITAIVFDTADIPSRAWPPRPARLVYAATQPTYWQ